MIIDGPITGPSTCLRTRWAFFRKLKRKRVDEMNPKYQPLFTPLTFPNGVQVASRFVLAPMVINGATEEGFVTEEELAFMKRRANSASLLITGSASVAPYGNAFGFGLSAESDAHLPGLKKLAQTMKSEGNLAILQLFHPGRGASYSYAKHGVAYGPSSKPFSFLDYPVTEMTEEQVEEMIGAFAQAARRAYEAGFDGVEIHGANHYLLQQFFSAFSNERTDRWGGSLEKRMQLTLDVVDAVRAMLAEIQERPFLVGYRISPEEIHGEVVGYTLEDSLKLVDAVVKRGVHYVSSSLFGPDGYKKVAQTGTLKGQEINQCLKEQLAKKVPLIVVGDVTQPEKALDALTQGDLVAIATMAIVEPDFKEKIAAGKTSDFDYQQVAKRKDLDLPTNFGNKIPLLARTKALSPEVLAEMEQQLKQKGVE